MSQYVDTNTKTFEADAAIALYARVKMDADGKITTAGIGDRDIGIACREAFAAGDKIPVKLRSGAGTHKMIASAAMTVGDLAYSAASGKIGASASGAYLLGTVLETASADGNIIEVLYNGHGDTVVP